LGVKQAGVVPRARTIVALSALMLCLAAPAEAATVSGRGAAASGPVPLIVDTDIFSNADDVGALASAFTLQLRGEAWVIAVAVNTRTSRPAVATNSWKCVAAIDNFYGFPHIPLGTHMPNNGTSLNTPDFVGPCAQLAPASTPAPDTAVNVYRRALASQRDGSVVVASTGYLGNLADLLSSPPDAISPLSGRDLVAQKVRTLVKMGGGYPSRALESNLAGDPAAAQIVSANWPTRIVWSGEEVGDAVHTGNTISSTHPANSPVRVAYETFVGPNKWIYSYDLTTVYHAVRPTDPVLSEVGPGTNAIDSSGANAFAMGSGNQYYLTLSDPTLLDGSIEALLDTLPKPSNTSLPVISGRATVGRMLASSTGAWSGTPPISHTFQWQRCHPGCSNIPGATGNSYTLTTADQGAKVRVGVTATNSVGSAKAASNKFGPISPARVSSRKIRALLVKALAAHGNGARIGALLKHRGYSFSFAAPSRGRLVISWHRASKHGKKVLVASVTVAFHKAGTARIKLVLTGQGRKLLNGASNVKLIAKGSFTPFGQGNASATKTLTLRS
jgi:inosine-uridine nucleoside N-ribohydrolase